MLLFVYLIYFFFVLFCRLSLFFFFFFNDTATTEIYTLSLHDALPISFFWMNRSRILGSSRAKTFLLSARGVSPDRKSTRLNSSHANISYAVFCLKKKKKKTIINIYIKSQYNKKYL